MQTDMTIREKATRLCTMIGVCSLGIYLAACDNGELPAGGERTAKTEPAVFPPLPRHNRNQQAQNQESIPAQSRDNLIEQIPR